jgi:hypothetical protein
LFTKESKEKMNGPAVQAGWNKMMLAKKWKSRRNTHPCPAEAVQFEVWEDAS